MLINTYLKKWFQLAGWKQILVGLIAGIVAGLLLGERAAILKPIGTIFIHAIQMLVAPVVVTAIVCAVLSVKDFGRMGKVISKSLLIYALCMAISATIGIVMANLLSVGYGFVASAVDSGAAAAPVAVLKLSEVLVDIVPVSPVQAFATNNVMQILCFAFLFGIALKMVGERGRPVQDFFISLSHVVFQLAKIVIGFAPYGIFALIAYVIGHFGLSALLPLFKFIVAVYSSCALLIIVVFAGGLWLNRISPRFFFKSVSPALITAFTTSSSAATLPVTMRCARENLKIERSLSDFLLPLGTTLNLNGLSIYLSVATVFAAHMFGIHLIFSQYIALVMAIILTAVGAAAIPGSALIVMGAVMSSVGIPLGALPLIAGVDRFNDMAQTMTNVTGDLFATALVAKSEGLMPVEQSPPASAQYETLE